MFVLFRGFLKSDKSIGQANIKLTNFSSKCEIHECVDVSFRFSSPELLFHIYLDF